jgi:CO/xanthine dehydrogenase Mo-binding subunit
MKKAMQDARFVSDLSDPEMVQVLTLRSAIAKGAVTSITPPSLPRGVRLILPADIPGSRELEILGTTLPILASASISYPGEPIALLCGPDPGMLKSILPDIKVEYDEEWPLFSFESFSSDQIIEKRQLCSGDPDAIFQSAPRVVERTFRTGSQEHFYPEPQGAYVEFDYDKLTVHSSTQWPFHVRQSVAAALDIRAEDIVVRGLSAGANMDGKLWYPSLVAVHAALATILCKRPARLLLTRQEDFTFTPKRSRSAISLKAALGEDLTLSALEAQVIIDMGAQAPFADEILDRVCASVLGPYRCPNVRVSGYAIRTNNLPLGACAGMGLSMIFFALESLVSELVESVECDQALWRSAQLLKKGETSLTGETAPSSPPFASLFELAFKGSDFSRKFAAYELLRKRGIGRRDGPLRGIGLAFAYQANGFLASGEGDQGYSAECTLDKGLHLTIRSSAVSSSPAAFALWARLAAGRLGIPEKSVSIAGSATNEGPDSGPATLSRNVAIVYSLLDKCLDAVQQKRFRDPLPITVRKTYKPPKAAAGIAGLQGFSFASLSHALCAVEVEISADSLEPEVTGVWIAIDGGLILSHERAAATIDAGVRNALSWASRERIEMADGRIPEHLFARYSLPSTSLSPPVTISFLTPVAKDKPRGIGELPFHTVPAAYARAVSQAIGSPVDSIPLDIDKIVIEVGEQ